MVLEKERETSDTFLLSGPGAEGKKLLPDETGVVSDSLLLSENHIYRGNLILVNQNYPVRFCLSENKLRSVFPGQPKLRMEAESAGMLRELLEEIQGNRKEIVGVSGYRTKEEQISIFQDSLIENGREFTEKYVAFPDHSEHQTGLAMDLAQNSPHIDFIRPEFSYDGICRKFRERAAEYGFIERYTEEKQTVTGIGTEPWHFRYVGVPHGVLIQENRMALEEYTEWLKQFRWPECPLEIHQKGMKIRTGYVKAQGAFTEVKLPGLHKEEPCHASSVSVRPGQSLKVSGNNVDGFVITMISEWEEA